MWDENIILHTMKHSIYNEPVSVALSSAQCNTAHTAHTCEHTETTIDIYDWIGDDFFMKTSNTKIIYEISLQLKWKRWHRVYFSILCFVNWRFKMSLIQLSIESLLLLLLLLYFSSSILLHSTQFLKYCWRIKLFLLFNNFIIWTQAHGVFQWHLSAAAVAHCVHKLRSMFFRISYVELHLCVWHTQKFSFLARDLIKF